MKKAAFIFFYSIIIFSSGTVCGQNNNSPLLDSLVKSGLQQFSSVISNPKKYRIQIIYTQINRDKNNKPSFTQHNYFLDSANYFYCASLVKLPCSILALQKLNELNIPGLDKNSKMETDSTIACHKRVKTDTSSVTGYPSVAHYIKKMLLVSDNLAYGRIYEFLTPDYIHDELSERGYGSMRIVHRFDGGCSGKSNLISNPVTFYDSKNQKLFAQPETSSKKNYVNPLGTVKIGRAHLNSNGKKINEPKDFTTYNFMHLQQINDILKWLVFYSAAPENKKFNLKEDDRKFLMKYLSLYPGESFSPRYNSKDYHDSYKKYFLYGDSKKPITNGDVKIFNIVGQSYGFMVDCAYIVDFKTNTEFMLSAVIYANEDGIINDGKYEYKSLALPFLSKLGEVILKYDQKRKRKTQADLSEFKLQNLSSE